MKSATIVSVTFMILIGYIVSIWIKHTEHQRKKQIGDYADLLEQCLQLRKQNANLAQQLSELRRRPMPDSRL